MARLVVIPMPGNEDLARSLAGALDAEIGRVVVRRFPDDETYLRFETALDGRSAILVCTLAHPDEKIMPLLFAAIAARELGASRVGLFAPYLAYMRQDSRFQAGEAITSNAFGHLLSKAIDWLVTIDPHLHRHSSLNELSRYRRMPHMQLRLSQPGYARTSNSRCLLALTPRASSGLARWPATPTLPF